MPERKKDKKTKDIGLEQLGGGAQIYIPRKRKRKIKYPKEVDPENPHLTPMPDPERWLPKWQRSRYKKLAKKKGLYLKGAQGDAQVNTDVTNLASSAPAQVKESGKQRNKRKRK